jgi:hypothetical protein
MKGCPVVSDEEAAQIDERMKTAYSWVQKNGPYEDWRLSNNSAAIRQAKARLEQLRALDEMPAAVIPFDGGKIEVDIEENRVKITFEERQSDEVTAKLKTRGFKWSRTNRCWQRLRTKHALWAAREICGVKADKTAVVSENCAIYPGSGTPIKTYDDWVNSGQSISEFYPVGELVSEDIITFLSNMGDDGVVKKEMYLQLRAFNYRHTNQDGSATSLHSTFKLANGVWTYLGLCAELPEDFCGICPCSSCLQAMPDGTTGDCHACDICIDGDISPIAPHCILDKRGADLLKVFAPEEAERIGDAL